MRKRTLSAQQQCDVSDDLQANFARIKRLKKSIDKVEIRSKDITESKIKPRGTKDEYLLAFLWWLSPTRHESDVRLSLYQQCLACLQAVDHSVKIKIFGSFMYGVGTPLSDLDMNITTTHPQLRSVRGLSAILQRTHAFYDFKVLRAAKVPIVKCKHKQTGVSLDFTINNESGDKTGQCAKRLLDSHPASRAIVVFVKYVLRAKGLMDVSQGGISSFALCLLAVSFLQTAPESSSFVETLVGFLYHYGYAFVHASMGININAAHSTAKPADVAAEVLYVLDPTNASNNVTKACRLFSKIQNAFRDMHKSLRSFLRQKGSVSAQTHHYFPLPDKHFVKKREDVNRFPPSTVDYGLKQMLDQRNFLAHICSKKYLKFYRSISEKFIFQKGHDRPTQSKIEGAGRAQKKVLAA